MSRIRTIVILSGGPSDEHDVSLLSGRSVFAAIDRTRYRPVLLVLKRTESPASMIRRLCSARPSVVYNALHGRFGEDGGIQAMLDSLHIPYTGSEMLSSAIGMDKYLTETIANVHGIRTPRSIFVPKESQKKPSFTMKPPFVIKPNASGSSVGVEIISSRSTMVTTVDRLRRAGHDCLVQPYLSGREFSCAVLTGGGKKDIAFPVIGIETSRPFFDYEAKYRSDETREICPAVIPAPLRNKIQSTALGIHHTLRCTGLTRSDFIVTKTGTVFFLEINTSPGMTSASLCPKAAVAYGWGLKRLINEQIVRAIRATS